jgi:HK97 family phage prohead protease
MAVLREVEQRTTTQFEIRIDDNGKNYIEGYGIKWEELSVPLGYFTKFKEKFKRDAFSEYLNSDGDTKFLVDHDIGKVLGRSKKGTLAISEDEIGLKYSLEIPTTTVGKDAFEDVRTGNKEHISVGFIKLKEEWDESDENNIVRTISKANLPEISLTAWPAYEQTTASTRTINDVYEEYRAEKEKSEPENTKKDDSENKLAEQRENFNKIKNKLLEV